MPAFSTERSGLHALIEAFKIARRVGLRCLRAREIAENVESKGGIFFRLDRSGLDVELSRVNQRWTIR